MTIINCTMSVKNRIKFFKHLMFLILSFFSLELCNGQKPDSLARKLDSLHKKADSAGGQINNINPSLYNEQTKITPSVYFILLGTDFVQEVTGPFHTSPETWRKVAGFGMIEGGLLLLDKTVQRNAAIVMYNNRGMKNISLYVTNFGGPYEGYTLAALGLYGWVFKNQKMVTTTLLATQAYIVGGVMESVLKAITGRQRPNYTDPEGPHPQFHGPAFGLKLDCSFPSGHTTVAFAAATVFAMEYRNHPVIPFICYSAASLIGLSRVTQNAHWISDVFAGAALGYVTGRQVVNNYHRYAYLKNHQSLKNKLSFGLEYNMNHLEPALYVALH